MIQEVIVIDRVDGQTVDLWEALVD